MHATEIVFGHLQADRYSEAGVNILKTQGPPTEGAVNKVGPVCLGGRTHITSATAVPSLGYQAI